MSVALRPRDRPRLGVSTVTLSQKRNPWAFQDALGRLHTVEVLEGNIRYYRSDFAQPPFAVGTTVTADGDDCDPRMVVDAFLRIRLLWCRGAPDSPAVYRAYSDDDGASFSEPSLVYEGGMHPTIAVGSLGDVLEAWYVGGNLVGTYQAPGDASPSSPFTLADDGGSPLSVEDDTFHFPQGHAADAPWVLVVVILGEGAVSRWRSWDEGRTWERV